MRRSERIANLINKRQSEESEDISNEKEKTSPIKKPKTKEKFTDSIAELLYGEDIPEEDSDEEENEETDDENESSDEDSDDEDEDEDSDEEETDEEESENDYFEYDFDKVKDTISKNISSKFKKAEIELSDSNFKLIREGIDESFELFEEVQNSLEKLAGNKPPSNLWKLGLGSEEIEKYSAKYAELREKIQKEENIKIPDILDSNLTDEDKKISLQLFDLIQNSEPYTEENINYKKSLQAMIEYGKTNKMTNSELEEIKNQEKSLLELTKANVTLKTKILKANIDQKRKSAIYEKYLQLQSITDDSTITFTLKEWIENALKTPFESVVKTRLDTSNVPNTLINIKKGLDQKLFGMDEVKEQILSIFNNILKNEKASGLSIGMLGSPGVGKTEIARSLADTLGLPFAQISLGGLTDSSILTGQHTSSVGSTPGRIIKALQEMKSRNGIILLDEIDKLGDTQHGREVQSSLLHISDFTQNKEFRDNYLGPDLSIDLSQIIFVYALNKLEGLDPAMLSRIPIVKVPDYDTNDKIKILRDYILPKLLKVSGIPESDIIFPDQSITCLLGLVDSYRGKEGGVRNAKDALTVIINKVAILMTLSYEQQKEIGLKYCCELKKPVAISPDLIKNLYKNPKLLEGPPAGMYN